MENPADNPSVGPNFYCQKFSKVIFHALSTLFSFDKWAQKNAKVCQKLLKAWTFLFEQSWKSSDKYSSKKRSYNKLNSITWIKRHRKEREYKYNIEDTDTQFLWIINKHN